MVAPAPLPRIAAIGEVMVELSGLTPDGQARIGYGGDTANTAIYLARLLGPDRVGYLTRLGDDPFAGTIAQALGRSGVALPPTLHVPGRQTGLYAIAVDNAGERSFSYWRRQAPARELLIGDTGDTESAWLDAFDGLYTSGITLAILEPDGRDRLLAIMAAFRAAGKHVILDTNLRPALWADATTDPRPIYAAAMTAASIVKIGLDEAPAILGQGAADAAIEGIAALGPSDVIVTDGARPIVATDGVSHLRVTPPTVARVIDATAAGDSFNAGFVAARLAGRSLRHALAAGASLAAAVVQHPGAIIPRAAMPVVDRA